MTDVPLANAAGDQFSDEFRRQTLERWGIDPADLRVERVGEVLTLVGDVPPAPSAAEVQAILDEFRLRNNWPAVPAKDGGQ